MEKLLITVACLASTAFGQGTPFALTTEQWQVILDMHQAARNEAAGGNAIGAGNVALPAAANMNSLVWDQGLADLAQSTANLCDGDHSAVTTADLGANTRFEIPATTISLGENLAFASTTPSFMIAQILTQAWLNELDLYTYTQIPSGGDAATGHYTQIIWADTRYIGCAMADCTGVLSSPSILVCQFYRPGNFIGQFPYDQGTACTACDTDRTQQCVSTNTGFENLCAGALDSTFGETNDGVSDITDDGLGRDITGNAPAPPGEPSANPTTSPSNNPSVTPTVSPSRSPTVSPNNDPSASPTASPSASPTAPTTQSPSTSPTSSPSNNPSTSPTASPSGSPTAATSNPSAAPSSSPSGSPSTAPTAATTNPSASPSGSPTGNPSNNPTASPVVALVMPSAAPSGSPTAVTQNPLYTLLAGLVGDTAARVILASDLTDAQVVALAALIASGADDAEILAFLQSTGISDAQILAIAVALDLDLDDGDVSISDSPDGDDDASS